VAVVREDQRGIGAWSPNGGFGDTDALVTDVPGILLGITIADCLPVYLYDPEHHAIGLAHSGWRGTAGRIVPNTIDLMRNAFGTDPNDVFAAIGPGICGRCYEVGDEVRDALLAVDAPGSAFRESHAGRWMLDLSTVVRRQLRSTGIGESNMSAATWCTSCHNHLFFSHRKEGPGAGRFGAFLKLD
jgi:YfiH family protein